MGGRARSVTTHTAEPLGGRWEVAAVPAGAVALPGALDAGLAWTACSGPMTVAAALRAAGSWSLADAPRRFDADDWWYRARFQAQPARPGEQLWLCLDGLATVAEVWLNGHPLLNSTSMFTRHERRVDSLLRPDNELILRFRSLDAELATRRPRPRWRVPMLEHQQLRWFRTTLLGRTPGWSPPAAPVGPWREVRLERRAGVAVEVTSLAANADGVLCIACRIESLDGAAPGEVSVVLTRDGVEQRSVLGPGAGPGEFAGRLAVENVALWWPHTHGTPALYVARLDIDRPGGPVTVELGRVGFRTISLVCSNGDFALSINGEPVFCRGACWTPLDPVSLQDEPAALARAIDQVVQAGMNMLRVGGTMVYPSDAFLDACDYNGILLWQDFMFANCDYPEDAEFLDLVTVEARQQLARLQGRPSLAVLCGNSEGEQQAAMWGAPRDRWAPALFHDLLADLAHQYLPGVPYTPSSAHGGAFPHQGNVGVSSYYGVGAYRRPLEDARRAEVRFASECLAFANIPEAPSLCLHPGDSHIKVNDPEWKRRSPRDLGANWDFEDVRDHYLSVLFGVEAAALRMRDPERYLELGRVATGEVMAQVFGEWRRRRSVTRGGLLWFLRDLWPGAGWGVVDALGRPKAAWHYLRRALAPVTVHISDEGGNGLDIHLANDRDTAVTGELELTLWRAGEVLVGRGAREVAVPPRSAIELNANTLFEEWRDLSYAYRFGPPPQDIIAAKLTAPDGATVGRAFHFVGRWPSAQEPDVGLAASAMMAPGGYEIDVVTRRFAQSVRLDLSGYECSDNYFHLAPGERRRVFAAGVPAVGDPASPILGTAKALNAETAVTVALA